MPPVLATVRLRCATNIPGARSPTLRPYCFYVDKSFHPLKQRDGIVEAAGSYNAALDLIHTALRAESEGERYTGALHRPALAFALRV